MISSKLIQYASRWRSTAHEVFGHSVLFAQFFSLLHITDTYICSPTLVHGASMLPTLNFTGDVLLVEKLSHRLGKVSPGDVVLVRSPENPRKTITKRVVGVEGDKVTFLVDPSRSYRSHSIVSDARTTTLTHTIDGRRGSIHRRGGDFAIRYSCEVSVRSASYIVNEVPKGHVWIQGDNIFASNDSRHFGSIPYGLILGKVSFRVWPPQDFGRLGQ